MESLDAVMVPEHSLYISVFATSHAKAGGHELMPRRGQNRYGPVPVYEKIVQSLH